MSFCNNNDNNKVFDWDIKWCTWYLIVKRTIWVNKETRLISNLRCTEIIRNDIKLIPEQKPANNNKNPVIKRAHKQDFTENRNINIMATHW